MIRKTDKNHKQIIDAIRKIPGATVFSTHTVGKGFPDIVMGYRGFNYLIEIKDGSKPPSQRKLTKDETRFHQGWAGDIRIVSCIDDILKILVKG